MTVENCHIRDGSIRPMLAATLSSASASTVQSLYRFNGAWETHTAERWYAEDNGVLYWADGGIPQKKRASDGAQARLGIVAPTGATITAAVGNAHGDLVEPVDLAVTFYSDPLLSGGWGGESAPFLATRVAFSPKITAITVNSNATATASATDTAIKLAGDPVAAGFKGDGGYVIVGSSNEVIQYTGVQYDGTDYSLTGCTRGCFGTTAQGIGTGVAVYAYGAASLSLAGLPTSADTQVNARRIYRLSAGEYTLVDQIDDNTATTLSATLMQDSDLAGNDLLESERYDPPENLDGICGPYNGMMFGWVDKTVYWSEVGEPDAWYALSQFTYRSAVAACVVFGGGVVVLCEDAPYIIHGSDPEALYRSKALSQQGCLNRRTAVDAGGMLLYLSPDGVCAFDGNGSQVVSGALAKSDFALTTPHAAYHDEQLFLFHTGGCIIGDFRDGKPTWRTCTETGLSAFRDAATDTLYLGRAGGVYEWDAGDSLTWRYWTGELAAGSLAQSKDFWFAILHAEGTTDVKLLVDGNERHHKADLYLAERRPYRMRLSGAARGYRPQVRLEGTGTVYALELEHSGPGRSR